MSEDAGNYLASFAFTEPAPRFTFHGEGNRVLLTIHPDGRLEFAPGANPEDAVRVLMQTWERILPESAIGRAVQADHTRLRAEIGKLHVRGMWGDTLSPLVLESDVLALLPPESP